jgi:hypothetical protein
MSESEYNRLFQELQGLRSDVQALVRNGCANSWQHRDHDARLKALEKQAAESRGKLAVVVGVVSLAASAGFQWLGRKLG